jgi:hypothetical protein
MNRGRRAEKIFSNKTDYTTFLELLILMESAEMWNVRIAAYCMVPNHYCKREIPESRSLAPDRGKAI